MTVKLKIRLAMALALLVALVLGGTGLASLLEMKGHITDLFTDSMVSMMDVTSVRAQTLSSRLAINRAYVRMTPQSIEEAEKTTAANIVSMDATWRDYYPAHTGTPEEINLAKRFIEHQRVERDLSSQALAGLRSGDVAKVKELLTETLGKAFNAESQDINEIVAHETQQAKESYEASMTAVHRTIIWMGIVALLGVVLVVAAAIALTRTIMRPLLSARELATRISDGELDHQLEVSGKDEFSDTLRALSTMDKTLSSIVSGVRESATQVNHAARDISAGNDDLSMRTQGQASSLEETAASMEEMAAAVKQNAESAEAARGISRGLRDDALAGSDIAGNAVQAMDQITDASRQIGEIAVLIDEIAFQTNLLSLNAAVEAARAGEQGRGFAVVAAEVRALAQRSATAAKDIKSLISSTVERVEAGAVLVGKTGQALTKIQSGASRMSDIVAEIASASQEQSAGVEQVNTAVIELDDVTQRNAALVEEASAAARHSLELSEELIRQVSFFRTASTSASDHASVMSAGRKQGKQHASSIPRLGAPVMAIAGARA